MRKILFFLSLTVLALGASGARGEGAGGRELQIVTLEFPPYVSAHLQGNGWAWEICETIFRKKGYRANLMIVPWARAVSMTQSGHADALYMANINEERKKWAVFTEPVGEEISVAFKRRDRSFVYHDPKDLAGLRVGGLKNAHVVRLLQAAGVEVYALHGLEQGFKMVYFDRLDMLVTDRYVGGHLLRTGMDPAIHNGIDFIETPVDANNLHLAVSKLKPDHEEIRALFNDGLQEMRENGEYGEILARYGF